MGDTVNRASRLEGACKHYGLPILIGESTFTVVKEDILAREVDLIRVVGKSKPERIYQPIEEKDEVTPDGIERVAVFHKALQFYRKQQWDEALPLFESFEKDRVAQIYVDRIIQLKKSPPSEDWSGVHELKQK